MVSCGRDSPSKPKLSDSTLLAASMLTDSAGCGTPIRTSGPQYATLVPIPGPGSM